jgi:hypothetical protein
MQKSREWCSAPIRMRQGVRFYKENTRTGGKSQDEHWNMPGHGHIHQCGRFRMAAGELPHPDEEGMPPAIGWMWCFSRDETHRN